MQNVETVSFTFNLATRLMKALFTNVKELAKGIRRQCPQMKNLSINILVCIFLGGVASTYSANTENTS